MGRIDEPLTDNSVNPFLHYGYAMCAAGEGSLPQHIGL